MLNSPQISELPTIQYVDPKLTSFSLIRPVNLGSNNLVYGEKNDLKGDISLHNHASYFNMKQI